MNPSIVTALAIFMGISGIVSQAQNHYAVTDLGTLNGASTFARKITAWGQAAATSAERDGGTAHAALWRDSDKNLVSLPTLEDGDYSEAISINNRGEMAGLSNTKTNMHAVLWSASGSIQDLGTLPGDTSSRAFAINDADKVVGMSSGPGGEHAFIWTYGRMFALEVPPGTKSSEAHAINNCDQVVGHFRSPSGTHAFLWAPESGFRDLGVLPGYQASKAIGVNDSGEVVGSSSGPFDTRSFIWTPRDGMQAVPDVPSQEFSEALDINNHSEVVGTYEGSLGNRAYLWTRKNAFVDLNTLIPAGSGVVLTIAVSINDRGQILALGVSHPDVSLERTMDQDEGDELHSIDVHSFLLTPKAGSESR
jgi:probable HAF family extracellular repeat protein